MSAARNRLSGRLSGVRTVAASPDTMAWLIAGCMPGEWADLPDGEAAHRVKVGIETERGPWVAALVAAGMRCSR
jgi:hypothetical protein